ncbi:MAG TPA: type II CRISPR RNA-guided endonuclease Cas9 [Pyrinomonadaceae bacterium]|nr:type II CRISPR RNA-guided endonuclease Cas9 [Pyrinomonadaceae bacterium]
MFDSRIVLGLDLGVTSVGWALLKTNFEDNIISSTEIIATGVRIFPATTEGTQSTPKNFSRRTSRGTRRLLRRKRQRKNHLREILVSKNLLPKIEKGESSEVFDALGNPYNLRVQGLSERLEPIQIGRAIYHLAKRRGFLSNRKSGKSKDDGVVFGGIAEVKDGIEQNNFKTLGQYLNTLDKKRKHYTARKMVEDEFEEFWTAQSEFYPEILNEHLKTDIKHIVFYQRPIQSQRGLIGLCSFEKGKKRCDAARQEAQRLRYWQDINNLQLQDRESLNWRILSIAEKAKLADEFEKKKEITYKGLRKLLRIDEDVRINLEANEKKLYGNKTAVALRKAIGKNWDEFAEEKQNRLIEELFRIESEFALGNRLKDFWKFDDAQIEEILKVHLESGYSRCSLKAAKKILPWMKKGWRYDQAFKAAAYRKVLDSVWESFDDTKQDSLIKDLIDNNEDSLREKILRETWNFNDDLVKQLLDVDEDHRKQFNTQSFEKLPLPPKDLRNPIVSKGLHELRKVVNAILREYGKPDEIHLEMARDLKLTAKQKERAIKQQNQNKRANEEAEGFYRKKFGLENVSGFDKLKYRLWKEADEMCPYTGEKIPPEVLMDDQKIDVEHIIPYSRCFDDSYMNKTICLAEFNRDVKKNMTPFELFGGDEQKYFEMLKRIENLPSAKQKKFVQKSVDENEMIGRQLSDTRYICKEARGYLLQLYKNEQSVTVVAGGATANLRHVWGLNSILADGDVDVKNRYDHRHHAIDAIVIALINRSLFQYISKLAGRNRELMKRNLSAMEMPWENFLTDVSEAINSIVISHAPIHRVRGALLEETAYGATNEEGLFVVRKNLESLSKSNIEKDEIVDETVREIIRERYNEFNGDLKKAFIEPLFHKDGKTPIKKARLYVKMSPETVVGIQDESGKPYKYYALGGNHHVEIFENPQTEERKAVLVPRFKAAQNVRESVKRGNTPSPVSQNIGENWQFLFSLCPNDYIEFLGDDGQIHIYRIQKMSGGQTTVITARPLEDARSEYISGISLNIQGKGFNKIIRKLQVDPLGYLTQAND